MVRRTTYARILSCAFAAGLVLAPNVFSQLIPNLGGQRAGISAFQFLKLGVGARGVAMGESFVAVANDASALYWNPAGLTQFNENQFLFAHTEYVADIRHEYFGAAYHLTPTDAIGVAVTSLYMDKMAVTTETQPFGTGELFSFGDVAVGVSYGRKMTDQFSFGVTLRYVEETLDILKMRGVMVDLGTYYWTGLGSSRFAIVISNFGADVAPTGTAREYGGGTVTSFQSFSPPTLFKMGFAMEPYQAEDHRVTTSLELNHPNDNAENVHLGVEYQWQKWLRLRIGVKRTIGESLFGQDNSSSGSYSLGLGVLVPLRVADASVDYAYSNFGLLGGIHRISLSLSY